MQDRRDKQPLVHSALLAHDVLPPGCLLVPLVLQFLPGVLSLISKLVTQQQQFAFQLQALGFHLLFCFLVLVDVQDVDFGQLKSLPVLAVGQDLGREASVVGAPQADRVVGVGPFGGHFDVVKAVALP